MKYRSEIDGLRAIALVPVTLFHAGFESFRGGFVGVDVFFVISGYLITTVIVADLRAGTFSLGRFYERRARRILPALLFVMLACLPFAWFLMIPDDFENFGQSLVATTFFSNNVLLWLTSGYFGLAAEFKPLAHTWSLGVEEQYYLAFPVLIALLWPFGKRGLFGALGALGIVSLAASDWGVTRYAAANFLLLPTRGWELLIGSAVALHLLDRPAGGEPAPLWRAIGEVTGFAGLALIAVAVFAFDRDTPFPGLHGLIPTLGTAVVILFATPATVAGRMLGCAPLAGIGLISYSGYLWQQPLFAFARLASLDRPGDATMAMLAAGSLVLAYPTWRLIERPFRERTAVKTRTFVCFALLGSALTASAGIAIHLASGLPQRWPKSNPDIEIASRQSNADYIEGAKRFNGRRFDDSGNSRVLILGDSFALDFINASLENGYFSRSSISYSSMQPSCIRQPEEVDEDLRALIAQSDYLIFGGGVKTRCWSADQAMFRRLGAKRLIVVGRKGFAWNINAAMLLEPGERSRYRARLPPEVLRDNARMRAAVPSGQYVDVLAMIVDGEGRVDTFTDGGRIISLDGMHLTRDGARHLGARLFEHPLLAPLK